MRISGFRCALSTSVAFALVAGCDGSQPPIAAPTALLQSARGATSAHHFVAENARGRLHYLYTFKGDHDGHVPEASLVEMNGTFYGTTFKGGVRNSGTVFVVTPSGKEQVLHSFGKHDDGAYPTAGLTEANGTLYGTTESGGAYLCESLRVCGTVFSIDSAGHERVLHSFGSGSDGYKPASGLLNVNGMFYGTTVYGGAYHGGTVFSVSTNGRENVVYNFGSSKYDGCEPWAGLIDVSDTIYGTTSNCGVYVRGTVFSLSLSGSEQVLHSFGYGSDGSYPVTGLLDVRGTLYGTTESGGANGNGNGTVYSISTSGNEQVIYDFDYQYGANPSGLVDMGSALYGTATGGPRDDGFIFTVTPSGNEHLLYDFGRRGGSAPVAALIDAGGKLFGTTAYGGNGFGTVFSVKPSH